MTAYTQDELDRRDNNPVTYKDLREAKEEILKVLDTIAMWVREKGT